MEPNQRENPRANHSRRRGTAGGFHWLADVMVMVVMVVDNDGVEEVEGRGPGRGRGSGRGRGGEGGDFMDDSCGVNDGNFLEVNFVR